MRFERESIEILKKALQKLEGGFADLPDFEFEYDSELLEKVTMEVAEKMQKNYPYFHPFYAGQMLKPPHPVARLAYMLSLWINPNNHALDGGLASSYMEKEAVSEIARLFNWEMYLGHLTGGGTMANLEALWISSQLKPGMKVVASEQAHYTHHRISNVLGLEFQSVPCDDNARMDLDSLIEILDEGNVGTVVATIGTTATGSIDPLPEIIELSKKYNLRVHADAAYGGYFTLVDNVSSNTREAFDCLTEADSIVIDPHKHGLQPYGCGCILYRDPSVGKFYKHDSAYTYFTSSELHLGEISLECSRPGASAVALWATQKLLPLVPNGEFAAILSKCRRAALELYGRIMSDKRFKVIFPPELDIVVWAPSGRSVSEISKLSVDLFNEAARENLHLAIFDYPSELLRNVWHNVDLDRSYAKCLRSCLMKPEHYDWTDRIWQILDKVYKSRNEKL